MSVHTAATYQRTKAASVPVLQQLVKSTHSSGLSSTNVLIACYFAGASRGVTRGWPRWPKPPPIPSKKKIQSKKEIPITTFTLHNKLHSELQWRRNALNVLWCYKCTDLTSLTLMQLLTDLPPLQHGDLTF